MPDTWNRSTGAPRRFSIQRSCRATRFPRRNFLRARATASSKRRTSFGSSSGNERRYTTAFVLDYCSSSSAIVGNCLTTDENRDSKNSRPTRTRPLGRSARRFRSTTMVMSPGRLELRETFLPIIVYGARRISKQVSRTSRFLPEKFYRSREQITRPIAPRATDEVTRPVVLASATVIFSRGEKLAGASSSKLSLSRRCIFCTFSVPICA